MSNLAVANACSHQRSQLPQAEVRGCRAGRVGHRFTTEEIAVSESTQDRPNEADEKAPKPGEQDTETVAGQPRKAPESKDGEQSKQDE
jgi:hypothetical protein